MFVFLCGATVPVVIRIYKENKALKSEPPIEDDEPDIWSCDRNVCIRSNSCQECEIYLHNIGKE